MTDSLITRGRCTCCRQRLRRWLHRLQVQQHTNTGTAATVKLNKEYGAPRAYHAPKLPPALVGAAAAFAVATSPVAACAHTLFFFDLSLTFPLCVHPIYHSNYVLSSVF